MIVGDLTPNQYSFTRIVYLYLVESAGSPASVFAIQFTITSPRLTIFPIKAAPLNSLEKYLYFSFLICSTVTPGRIRSGAHEHPTASTQRNRRETIGKAKNLKDLRMFPTGIVEPTRWFLYLPCRFRSNALFVSRHAL